MPRVVQRDVEGVVIAQRAAAIQPADGAADDQRHDLILVARQDTVIGTTAARHDLSGLDVPLRSHGGVTEQRVPLIVNRQLEGLGAARPLRNFDAFDLALNHVVN